MRSIGFDLSKCQKEENGWIHAGTKAGNVSIAKKDLDEIGVTSGQLFNLLLKLELLAPLRD